MSKSTLILMVVGLGLRLFLIFPGPLESKIEFFYNRADLRNYYWPAQAVLHGENPYVLWSTGRSGDFRADMAPLELLIYVATVTVWNDARAIQILFALFDVVNIGLLGLVLARSPLKTIFPIFYALGPLTVYNLVLVPEDKSILSALTFMIFYFLLFPRDQIVRLGSWRIAPGTLAIISAAVLASFKWLSAFYLLPLLLFASRDVRDFIKHGILFGAVVAIAHLPWIPDWLYVYTFRSGRTATPMHIAPAVLLQAVGVYDKNLLMVVLAGSLLAIYALYWFKRIDILETIALSAMVGILWTPDMDPVHLSIVVVHFLLIVNWTGWGRLASVWSLSTWVAAVYAFSTRTGFTRYGLPDLRMMVGAYGSVQMIILSYVLFAFVLGLYVFDKFRKRPVGQAFLNSVEA